VKNVYLFQPQYVVEFQNKPNYWLPYSAGCLWSYAGQFTDIVDNFQLAGLYFRRDPIDQVICELDDPVLCGFSCYMWNEQYCLELARQVKIKFPDCVIIFGGPQSSSQMYAHQFIDAIALAEGEESFVKILRSILHNNTVDALYPADRLQDLDIPSPYLTGVFDNIISANPDAVWAMTLETNRGCPYACTFCDWGGVTYSKIKRFGLERVDSELEWAASHQVAYIFCADANFGIFVDRDLEISRLMRQRAENSAIEVINIQYAKNSTNAIFEIAKTLGPYGRGVTVSVQSMNESTLEAIKRKNLDVNNIREVMQLSEQYQVPTYTEVIIGLPLETKHTWIQGLCELLELGQHNSIDIWFAQMLENSELATAQSRQQYGLKTIWVKDYMNLDSRDQDAVAEQTEIVAGTSTMTTDDIIEGYVYAWMIIHWHAMGYTQIIARYARQVKNIAYQTLYDQLFKLISTSTVFQEHYHTVRSKTHRYLTQGVIDGVGGHAIHSISYEFMYQHQQDAAELALSALSMLTEVDQDLIELQRGFIVDFDQQYPLTLTTSYNIITGAHESTMYKFTARSSSPTGDFYTARRKGLIKNRMETL